MERSRRAAREAVVRLRRIAAAVTCEGAWMVYVRRARRRDRDRAEHARGGEESVAAVDTKRWRGGKIGEGASRVSRDVRITQIVPATDRGGRGGHQSTDGGWQK